MFVWNKSLKYINTAPLFILFVLAIVLCVPVYAEQDSMLINDEPLSTDAPLAVFRVYVDKSVVRIGDRIKYTMEIEYDSSVKVKLPEYADDPGGFVIHDFGSGDARKAGKDRVLQTQWYILDTFTVGPYVIPAQRAVVISSDGREYTVESPEVFVEVKSVMESGEDDRKLRDIKNVKDVSRGFPAVILIIAGLIALAAGIWRVASRKDRIPETIEKHLTPYEKAMQEIRRIEDLKLVESGAVKEYYYLVSACLRTYIEDRFMIRAPEQTTEEFLQHIISSGEILPGYVNTLKEYLQHCDLVKYAQFQPDGEQVERILETSKTFIAETADFQDKAADDVTMEVS